MKRYQLNLGVIIYNEGEPRVLSALLEVKAFIETNSKFKVKLTVQDGGDAKPSYYPNPSTAYPPTYLLGAGDVNWEYIYSLVQPETKIVLLTWSCGDLLQCPTLSGATWPVWEWLKGWPVAFMSIAYKKSTDTSWEIWVPDKDERKGIDGIPTQVLTGYSSGYVTTVVNELILCLYFWLHRMGFSIPWPYDLKQEDYPDCQAQDRAWLAFITDEMYEKVADFVPEPPAPTIPPELKENLVDLQISLEALADKLLKIQMDIARIIESLPM